jgi:hypothetical protein
MTVVIEMLSLYGAAHFMHFKLEPFEKVNKTKKIEDKNEGNRNSSELYLI